MGYTPDPDCPVNSCPGGIRTLIPTRPHSSLVFRSALLAADARDLGKHAAGQSLGLAGFCALATLILFITALTPTARADGRCGQWDLVDSITL